MRKLSSKLRQELIDDMLADVERGENEFPVINEKGKVQIPILSGGVVKRYDEVDVAEWKGYRGLALEINDHGNVTVYEVFKNGNFREVASRV